MKFFGWLSSLFLRKPTPVEPSEKKTVRILRSPGFGFQVEVDGNDLVVRDTRATCFGGSNDPQDSGETASGISTKDNPGIKACSLPMNYTGSHRPTRDALFGSPLPRLPWKTKVHVTCEGHTYILPVIDLGPAKYTGNGIDLTVAAAMDIDPAATARNFSRRVTYRIPGGAAFL